MRMEALATGFQFLIGRLSTNQLSPFSIRHFLVSIPYRQTINLSHRLFSTQYLQCFNSLQVDYQQKCINQNCLKKVSFNSLQVDYQLLHQPPYQVHQLLCFNSLQVDYQRAIVYFQLHISNVSIPYRQTINPIGLHLPIPLLSQFQFLIGRLSTFLSNNGSPMCTSAFQFLIGRLSTFDNIMIAKIIPQFQFLIGRLSTPNTLLPLKLL